MGPNRSIWRVLETRRVAVHIENVIVLLSLSVRGICSCHRFDGRKKAIQLVKYKNHNICNFMSTFHLWGSEKATLSTASFKTKWLSKWESTSADTSSVSFVLVQITRGGWQTSYSCLQVVTHMNSAIDFIAITQGSNDSWAPPNHAALRGDSVSAPQGQQGRSRFVDIWAVISGWLWIQLQVYTPQGH